MAKVRHGLGQGSWVLLVFSTAIWVAMPLGAQALDAVLTIASVTGGAPGSPGQDGVVVESFSFEIEHSGSTHAAGGGGIGVVSFSDLRVVKSVDAVSPILMYLTASHGVVPNAVLYVGATSAPGGAPASFDFSIEMQDVRIVGVEQSGGLNAPSETITINFSDVTVDHQAVPEAFNWDIQTSLGSYQ